MNIEHKGARTRDVKQKGVNASWTSERMQWRIHGKKTKENKSTGKEQPAGFFTKSPDLRTSRQRQIRQGKCGSGFRWCWYG